jgi:lipoprotein-anchoring transpeptidase ErfK/SrfK
MQPLELNRRTFLAGASALSALALAGCVTSAPPPTAVVVEAPPPPAPTGDATAELPLPELGRPTEAEYQVIYGPVTGEKFPIPPIAFREIDPAFLRQVVRYDTTEQPGTIVIDPKAHFLYHVLDGGRAARYGVGVGREGFAWNGTANIRSKQEWPDWYPPSDMFERQPELKKLMKTLQGGLGMPGGPGNPLGCRAMYLWQGNKDTLYRIHGTIEPHSIGKSVSSGCIRMLNQDVINLYSLTPVGTKVIVL